mmetsp:Transcript_34685/g.58274  ORF Transcript_34685/g.58274 Transcript_34685/m.58274 type:complete len:315 (+) Transcript_34685:3968-4912(+)
MPPRYESFSSRSSTVAPVQSEADLTARTPSVAPVSTYLELALMQRAAPRLLHAITRYSGSRSLLVAPPHPEVSCGSTNLLSCLSAASASSSVGWSSVDKVRGSVSMQSSGASSRMRRINISLLLSSIFRPTVTSTRGGWNDISPASSVLKRRGPSHSTCPPVTLSNASHVMQRTTSGTSAVKYIAPAALFERAMPVATIKRHPSSPMEATNNPEGAKASSFTAPFACSRQRNTTGLSFAPPSMMASRRRTPSEEPSASMLAVVDTARAVCWELNCRLCTSAFSRAPQILRVPSSPHVAKCSPVGSPTMPVTAPQ